MITKWAAALAAAIALAGCASSGSRSSTTTHQQAAVTPSPAVALSAGELEFVSTIRTLLAADGLTNSSTSAQLAKVGHDICALRSSGGSQASVISATAGSGSNLLSKSLTAGRLVRTAEKDLCPAEYPKPAAVLLRISGNGIQNSAPFTVTSSTLAVTYSYDCSSFGSSGNFIADLETADQSDDQQIANALGSGGTTTTTIYPQDEGSDYHLSVNSECDWTVVIKTAG